MADPTNPNQPSQVEAERRLSRVLTRLPCTACRRTLGWLVVRPDPLGGIAFELAAPVKQVPLAFGEELHAYMALELTGRRETIEAGTVFVPQLYGEESFRVSCRCGTRNYLTLDGLRALGETHMI